MPSLPSPLAPLTDRQRGSLALVLGAMLLLNPLYVTGFHVASTEYTYRTAPIHADDGRLVVEGVGADERVRERIAGIGCTGHYIHLSRACELDRRILASGPVRANRSYEGGPRYVRLDGAFYRRVVDAENGTVRLDVRRVSAREALDGAAIVRSRLTWPGRIALLTGGVTTTYPLTHAGHVVETSEGYRLLYLASFTRHGSNGRQSVFYLVGILAGLWLIRRGYRRLPAGEERGE